MRTSGFICALLCLSSLLPITAKAQVTSSDSASTATPAQTASSTQTASQPVRGIQYVPTALDSLRMPLPLFAGVSVSGDVVGLVMAAVSSYGQFEGAVRVNLRGRFFPTFEAGWGLCDHTDESTDLHYKTGAPFFRIGCDYNFARDLRSGNRIFGGLRYAFSSFDYDLDGPAITDPVWGGETPFQFEGLHATVHWVEIVFGLEAQIWKYFHMGWTARYRLRLSNSHDAVGAPWYVPGYGKNDGHVIMGTFNLIFDI